MPETKYLIAGSSHAGLEALRAIRMIDREGSVTMVTRDDHLPYSPTVLPYVVSGRSEPEKVVLRDQEFFRDNKVDFVRGAAITSIDPSAHAVTLASGATWNYGKLLLATGATPAIPPIKGLADVSFHVLRTLDDAVSLREAVGRAQTAVVLGAGLVGMHAAENLVRAGATVSIVEMQKQVLPGYFDAMAAGMIAQAFTDNGAHMLLDRTVVAVAPSGAGCELTLDSADKLTADLLLVATGVKPVIDYLAGSGIDTGEGILVGETMATSAADVWAAGDVAQARDFFGSGLIVNAILPDAVEQGRIAGMAMAEDRALKPYPGGLPINTYTFFGNHAISVGSISANDRESFSRHDPDNGTYRTMTLEDGRLLGIAAINEALDAGIMWQLILRGVDLSPVMDRFLADPLKTGRALMSSTWG